MRRMICTFLILLTASGILVQTAGADSVPQASPSTFDPLSETFPAWERLNGPPGGYVETIEQCAAAPDTLYATGSSEGLYKSVDRGLTWQLLPGGARGGRAILAVDPRDPAVVYGWDDGLAKSLDEGLTWQSISRGFEHAIWVQDLIMDPSDPDTLYVVGPQHGGRGCGVWRSANGGLSWRDISPSGLPHQSTVAGFAVQQGTLLLGINDRTFAETGTGRVLPTTSTSSSGYTSRLFVSENDGVSWDAVDYGTTEPRFIWSLYANPFNPSECWISEGPLFNEGIEQPLLFRSTDRGQHWQPVDINTHGWDSTQVRVIGSSPNGAVYVAAGSNLLVSDSGGRHFRNITPSRDQMNGVDFFDIEVDVENPQTLYLPLRSGGIAYSEDGGLSWERRDDGIASISANLIEADPFSAGTVYVSSLQGQGIYRSDDYGATWSGSLDGIDHPWGDEIVADPHNEGVVWFIADVPLVHRSEDFGDSWEVVWHPDWAGSFNFGSIYALAQGQSPETIYVLDNGFGIFKGTWGHWEGQWEWQFLRTTEIDYTYALVVDPKDESVLYSGYSRKPFEDFAMVRQSTDAGASWKTSLRIEGAEAVTSISVNPSDASTVYAAATGQPGGVWRTQDGGNQWSQPNPWFNFTTVHSFATASSDIRTACAGIWGGGTYITQDAGATWTAMDANVAFSAAGIAMHPADASIVYIADRTEPVLYRSSDSGSTFETVFDGQDAYARLMTVAIDPSDPECVYTIAMNPLTAMDRAPGVHGSVFRIQAGVATDITGNLPRLPLAITVDPTNSQRLYAVLHGSGVYRSDTGGTDWIELSGPMSGLPDSGFFNLIMDPDDADTVYLVGGCDVRFGSFASAGIDPGRVSGIYRSTNAGQNWECLNAGTLGAASGPVKSLSFSDKYSGTLVAAAENGLYISTDDGESWRLDQAIPYATLGGAVLFGDYVLAMTNGAGVLRGRLYEGGSIQWEADSVLQARVFFSQVIADSNNDETLYATGYPGGVFKSTDGGATWHEANFGMTSFSVEDPLRQGYYALALAPSDSNVLYLGLYGKGVYKSTDAAGTWMPMNGYAGEMLGQYVTALSIDPDDANHVFISTEQGIFRTTDGGETWQSANHGMPTTDVRTIAFTHAKHLYAGTRGYGLYRWHEGANGAGQWRAQNPVGQWGVIWPMWNDRPRYQYSDMLFHAENNARMMFGCFPAGIYRSDDGGETWRERNVGWTLDGVFSLISHPEDPDIVYAGTYNGVNRSLDFGDHWEMWDEGWPDEQWVFRVAFDPRDPNVMYACSKNGENEGTGRSGFRGTVMKSIDGGVHWFSIANGVSEDQEFYDLVVDPVNPDVIYLAVQHEGMFVSLDGGASWHAWNDGLDGRLPATNGNNVTRVLALSKDARYLYYGADGAGVFRREIHSLEEIVLSRE